MRLGIRPPGVKDSWEENGVHTQALILAFDHLCEHDEAELLKSTVPRTSGKR